MLLPPRPLPEFLSPGNGPHFPRRHPDTHLAFTPWVSSVTKSCLILSPSTVPLSSRQLSLCSRGLQGIRMPPCLFYPFWSSFPWHPIVLGTKTANLTSPPGVSPPRSSHTARLSCPSSVLSLPGCPSFAPLSSSLPKAFAPPFLAPRMPFLLLSASRPSLSPPPDPLSGVLLGSTEEPSLPPPLPIPHSVSSHALG